jgi:hypothetical protein
MKRDFDLIRLILLAAESASENIAAPAFSNHTNSEVSYHIRLLVEAGLLGHDQLNDGYLLLDSGYRLTWQGHDFLDNIRQPAAWKRLKLAIEKAGGLSFELLKQLALKYASETFLN